MDAYTKQVLNTPPQNIHLNNQCTLTVSIAL